MAARAGGRGGRPRRDEAGSPLARARARRLRRARVLELAPLRQPAERRRAPARGAAAPRQPRPLLGGRDARPGRGRPRRRSGALQRARHRAPALPPARARPRGGGAAPPRGPRPRARRDRPAHRRRARGGDRGPRGRAAPLLRRDRAHRRGRLDRHVDRVRPLTLRKRGGGRLPQPAVRRGAVPRVRGGAARRREGAPPRVRGAALLRGLPADRGDGGARPGGARLRADEAGRPRGPAHREAPVRGRPAPARGRRGDGVQPRRVPDAPHLAGAEAHLPRARARPRRGRVRAARPDPPEHVPRGPPRPRARSLRARAATPVLRGADHRGRGLRRVRRLRAPRRTRHPGSARGPAVPAAAAGDRARGAPSTSHRRGPSAGVRLPADERRVRAVPPLTGRHRGKAARKGAHAERARKEIAPWIDPWSNAATGAPIP